MADVAGSEGKIQNLTLQELQAILAAITGGSGGTSAQQVQGNVANDAPDAGNPVGQGALAVNPDSPPANVTALDRVRLIATLNGMLIDWQGSRNDPVNDAVGNAPFALPLEGAHTQDTTIDSVTTITPTGSHIVLQATVSGKNVRYTLDGTNPTTSFGFVMVAQDPPVRFSTAGKTFKVIAETAGAAIDWQNEEYA